MLRRLFTLLFFGALALVASGAAPASSDRRAAPPPAPRAHDFERPLPSLRHAGPAGARISAAALPGHGPVTYRSGVIDAPQRFDAVGVAGALKPIEFRARKRGGRWTRWVQTTDGNPVYTGGSDQVELRSRGWRPRGALHYVRVSTPASAPVALANGSAKSSSGPHVVTRAQWGATRARGGCLPRTAPSYGTVKAAVVHHTVSANSYTEAQAPGVVLAICRYHRNANGWNDIGYNALVDRFGNIYVGRAGGLARPVVGAHAQGFNAQTTGVAAIGDYSHASMPQATIRAIARLLAWKLPLSGRDADHHATVVSTGGPFTSYPAGKRLRIRNVVGHTRLDETECPGTTGKTQLPQIRKLTQARIDKSGGASHHGHGGHGGGGGGIGPGA